MKARALPVALLLVSLGPAVVACDLLKPKKDAEVDASAAVATAAAVDAGVAAPVALPAVTTAVPTLGGATTAVPTATTTGGAVSPVVTQDAGKPATVTDAGAAVVDAGKAAPSPTPTFTVPTIPGFDAGAFVPPGFDAGAFKPPWVK